jgi:hypothetical protein
MWRRMLKNWVDPGIKSYTGKRTEQLFRLMSGELFRKKFPMVPLKN